MQRYRTNIVFWQLIQPFHCLDKVLKDTTVFKQAHLYFILLQDILSKLIKMISRCTAFLIFLFPILPVLTSSRIYKHKFTDCCLSSGCAHLYAILSLVWYELSVLSKGKPTSHWSHCLHYRELTGTTKCRTSADGKRS